MPTPDQWIRDHRDDMVELQAELTRRPAIGPENDGEGEWEKARFLEDYLARHGISDVAHFDCPDERVPEGSRPNFRAAVGGGEADSSFWVLTHLDVVPPGNRKPDGTWEGWDSDPFEVRRDGDVIVGRGVLDNQQSMVSSIFGLRALLETGGRPSRTVKLLFVADEETGSDRGLSYVLREHRDLFSRDDMVVVPDGGSEDGSMIEVAEKSVLWLEFAVEGRQAHGSRPDKGVNAFRAASRLVCQLDEGLRERFSGTDQLYEPAGSTFEPTLHAANVPNVNTIPGEDAFCFDCRILPEHDPGEVLAFIREQCARLDQQMGTATGLKIRTRMDAPPPTPPDAPVVEALATAGRDVLGVDPQVRGVGGMTVASFFRAEGLPAAVWMTSSGTEHQVNETCRISDMVGDARVFAHAFST